MIFGQGISTSIAYTHRNYRDRQAAARAKIEIIRFRHQQCTRYGITKGEYLRRFQAWCELRKMVRAIRKRYSDLVEREQVTDWMMEKERFRAQNRQRLAEKRIEQKAKADFAAFIGPPVD